MGCHFLLQEIFPTQGLNPGLPHFRQTLYRLSQQGSTIDKWLQCAKIETQSWEFLVDSFCLSLLRVSFFNWWVSFQLIHHIFSHIPLTQLFLTCLDPTYVVKLRVQAQASQVVLVVKNLLANQCWRHKKCGFNPWIGKIPWRWAWQPTPVFLPGEYHGQKSLVRQKSHKVAKDQTWLK